MGSRKGTILLGTGVLFGASGCGLLFDYPETEDEASAAACADGIDNDLDGRDDCDDTGCTAHCLESDEVSCTDGVDNDRDEAADCLDSACAPYCTESDATACSDSIDNNNNGFVDCEDRASCAGFCPEESSVDCSDGMDNDGDTLSDANDPRCWPIEPPLLRRCADRPRVRFLEPFDEWAFQDSETWFSSGLFADEFGDENSIATTATSLLHARFLGFRFNTTGETKRGITNLGSATARRVFVGSWRALRLSFEALVPVGAAVRVALVPEAMAAESAPPLPGAETALMALGLDNSVQPPLFTLTAGNAHLTAELPGVEACTAASLCDEGFRRVSLQVVDGTFEASLVDSEVTLKTPVRSEALPPSRLVLWGGSWSPDITAGIDNLDLSIGAEAPCGFPAPQIPGSSCAVAEQLVSVGHSVSMARDADGEFCALATATTQGTREVVSSWTSVDGEGWKSARDEVVEIPGADAVVGVSVVHDGQRFRAAVAYRQRDEVRLAFARSRTCSGLIEFEAGPALSGDAEAPSYIVTSDGLEIYFTRPPTDETDRTLWRISGVDEESLSVEPYPVAELASVGAPVVIQKVGEHDLVMTYPELAPSGVQSIGIAVSKSDDSGAEWTPVGLVTETDLPSALEFDSDGVVGVSLHWDHDRGFLLYAGSRNQVLSVGTAQLFPSGTGLPEASESPICGDGRCEGPGESCEACPFDCKCSGLSLLENPADPLLEWISESQVAALSSGDGSVWYGLGGASLALETPVSGDFELGFELTLARTSGESCDFWVGLLSRPDPDAQGEGVFAEFHGCNGRSLSGLPVVITADGQFGATEILSDACTAQTLEIPREVRHRLLLRRTGAHVTLESTNARNCNPPAIDYTGALAPLRQLVVGLPGDTSDSCEGTVALSALSLRLLDDPEECPSPKRLCPGDDGLHYCIDVAESQEHCGACGSACSPNQDCVDGSCQCAAGYEACSDGCVDLMTSISNCGSCNHACSRNCFQGECDVGEDCSSPKLLPSKGGDFLFNLGDFGRDVATCQGGVREHDAVFAWKPSMSGGAEIQASGAPDADIVFSVGLEETCSLGEDWVSCSTRDFDNTPLQVNAGTTYYIIVSANWAVDVTLKVEMR